MIRSRPTRYAVISLTLLSICVMLVSPVSAAGIRAPASPTDTIINHLVTNLVFNYPSPSVLLVDQDLEFTFNYTTNQPEGVQIFGRPITDGSLSPNYGAHGSPVYPAGSGSGSGFFTISSGAVLVDGIRLQIWNAADPSMLLYETVLPVHYLFTDQASTVASITLSPASPNSLGNGQNVTFPFQYTTDQVGGTRIFGRPLTGGSLSPNYGAHGSPLYPTGTGMGSGNFTITSGDAIVDGIRFQQWDDTQATLLSEIILPVHYIYTGGANRVTNVALSLASPNVLLYGQDLNVSFTYATTEPGGVRIFVRPVTNGALSASYAAHGSPLYPSGSGTGSGFFTITSGPERVDGIRIQMVNADQSLVLFEAVLPVHYQFGPSPLETAGPLRMYIPLVLQQ